MLGSLLAFYPQFASLSHVYCVPKAFCAPPFFGRGGEAGRKHFPRDLEWTNILLTSLPSSLSISSRSLGPRGGSLAVYEGLGCIRHIDTFTRVKGGSKGCGKNIFLAAELGPLVLNTFMALFSESTFEMKDIVTA